MQAFIERIDLYPVLYALKDFLIKRLRSLLEHIKRTANFSHSATSQRSDFRYSAFLNLLAANSISCCLRTASPQGIAALAAQGGVATLTERSDAAFEVKQFSPAEVE